MYKFYKKAALLLAALVAATVTILWLGHSFSRIGLQLYPLTRNSPSWTPQTIAASPHPGTELSLLESNSDIRYRFRVGDDMFPYIAYILAFDQDGTQLPWRDLSAYQKIAFRIRCEPKNVLLFAVFSHDPEVTLPADSATHRVSSTFFTCENEFRRVELALRDIETPDWWLEKHNLVLTDRSFALDKVYTLRFVNSLQSPRNIPSEVAIEEIRLSGEKRGTFYLAAAFASALWAVYAVWFFRQYMHSLVEQTRRRLVEDRLLSSYQKLSIAPIRDKEISAVMKFMATHYSDPGVNLEKATEMLGVNRQKLNEILKAEVGMTFSGYLNKLRLTEAARLLTESANANISEVAFAVGYNNLSYFSKLFKEEYGCSPKLFRHGGPPPRARESQDQKAE